MPTALQGPVAGKAVYLEFTRPTMVTQILVMPEGMTSSHKIVPLTIYRRRLSSSFPRRTWKMLTATTTSDKISVTTMAGALPTQTQKAELMLTPLTRYLESMLNNGWTLKIAPVLAEVTTDDLEQCRMGKTPYKALSRVWKARKFMGFPKEFIPEPEPAPTPPASF